MSDYLTRLFTFLSVENMTARDRVCFLYDKITNILVKILKESNSLDPDQAQYFVGPNLCPNCLQMLSVEKTLARVKRSCQKFLGYLKKKISTYDPWCSSTMIVQTM